MTNWTHGFKDIKDAPLNKRLYVWLDNMAEMRIASKIQSQLTNTVFWYDAFTRDKLPTPDCYKQIDIPDWA